MNISKSPTLNGLTAYYASKLKSLGIRTTAGLLEPTDRQMAAMLLAAKTSISEQQL